LKTSAEKISVDVKANVEAKMNELKDAVKSDNIDEIKSKIESLNKAMYDVSSELYKQSSKQNGKEEPKFNADDLNQMMNDAQKKYGQDKNKGNVVDADFEMVDDKKK